MPITGMVQRITIVFDEGTDAFGAPDSFGAAILDNIDINGTLVEKEKTDGAWVSCMSCPAGGPCRSD